ncbi:hypothetical protein ACH4ND_01360 [Streptomyces sp. NPDC017179]|uniref:hypothetical protein n=1 Tax=Streptomyces sp. NPDC017179 TaxID=3364979 RepID=UPI0037893A50
MSMFSQPTSGGGFFKPADANGHLILITTVHEITKRYDELRKQEMDNATVDLVDLDLEGQEVQERIVVSHPAIVNRLAAGATMTLGRIGQVATKSGFQAWALLPFAEGSDDARAAAWVTAHQPTFTQAAAPQPAPAPAAAAPAPAPQPTQYAAPAPAAQAPADPWATAAADVMAAAPHGVNPVTGEITGPATAAVRGDEAPF